MISIKALTKYGCNQCSTGFHAASDCELGVDTYSSISAIEETRRRNEEGEEIRRF
ncbi:hypothetical protein LINPERHAP1_LOCUS552 [Linum perenne]